MPVSYDYALRLAEQNSPKLKLLDSIDLGDRWAFYFGMAVDEPEPGVPYVTINKATGELSYLPIPPLKNLDVLKAGKRIG